VLGSSGDDEVIDGSSRMLENILSQETVSRGRSVNPRRDTTYEPMRQDLL
jgi:hypothetical protein